MNEYVTICVYIYICKKLSTSINNIKKKHKKICYIYIYMYTMTLLWKHFCVSSTRALSCVEIPVDGSLIDTARQGPHRRKVSSDIADAIEVARDGSDCASRVQV